MSGRHAGRLSNASSAARLEASRASRLCSSVKRRRPSGGRGQARRISKLNRNVGGRRVRGRRERRSACEPGSQHLQDVGDASRRAAAHVVDLSGRTVRRHEDVGAHCIADVQEVSLRVEVSDGDGPCSSARLSRCDLRCECSADEVAGSPGPTRLNVRVTTTSAPARAARQREQRLRALRDSVRRERPKRVRARRAAVPRQARSRTRPRSPQSRRGSADADRDDAASSRCVPTTLTSRRSASEALRSAPARWKTTSGPYLARTVSPSPASPYVEPAPLRGPARRALSSRGADDLDTELGQVSSEMASDEARGAGDESARDQSSAGRKSSRSTLEEIDGAFVVVVVSDVQPVRRRNETPSPARLRRSEPLIRSGRSNGSPPGMNSSTRGSITYAPTLTS